MDCSNVVNPMIFAPWGNLGGWFQRKKVPPFLVELRMDLIFQFWVPYGMYSYNGRAKESIVGNAIDLPKNGSESHKNGNLFQGVFPWLHRSNDYEMSCATDHWAPVRKASVSLSFLFLSLLSQHLAGSECDGLETWSHSTLRYRRCF